MPRREPRPLLPRARRHADAGAEPRYPGGSSRPTGATATSWPGATSCSAARPPTGSRSRTRCGARSSGCAAAPRRDHQGEGPHRRGGRLIEELADLKTRAAAATAGIDSRPPAADPPAARRARAHEVARRPAAGPRPRPRRRRPARASACSAPTAAARRTLLRLLAGTLAPDAGRVERAEGLRLVRFDQDRAALDPAQPLRRALAPGGRRRRAYQGRPMHVAAWAKRFLFRPSSSTCPSGGSRAASRRAS